MDSGDFLLRREPLGQIVLLSSEMPTMEQDNITVPRIPLSENDYVRIRAPKVSLEEHETYNLGNFKLKSGEVLPNAPIAYKTFGDPRSPAIIYPTWFSGCE
jgi:hypothetical protein